MPFFRCPKGHIGRIDSEQLGGDVSIICASCDFHGYVDDGEVLSNPPERGNDPT